MIQRWTLQRASRWLRTGPGLGYSLATLGLVGNAICFPLQAYGASVAFTLAGIVGFAVADLRALACLAFPALSLAGEVVSLGYIESGAYVSEQRRFGFNIGATPLFGVYAIAFLGCAHIALTWLASRSTPHPPSVPRTLLLRILVVSSGAVGLIYAAIFLGFGTGLALRTRFEWVASLPPLVAKLHVLLRQVGIPVIFGLLGIYSALFGVRRSWRWLIVTLVPIFALIGTGEKFTSFILIICMVITGFGIGRLAQGEQIHVRRVHALVGLGLAVLLFISLVAGYRRMLVNSPLDAILNRTALQGHVWFGIFARFHGEPAVPIGLLLRRNSLDAPSGLDLLSYYVADPEFVRRRISEGITFTMGGPPGVLSVFGAWWGLVVYTLLGLLYVGAIALAVYFLQRRRLLLVTPFALILYLQVNMATLMGFWEALYGAIAFTCYAAIVAAVVVTRVRRARKRGLSHTRRQKLST